MKLTTESGDLLIAIAGLSIRHGLATGLSETPDEVTLPTELAAPGASFVTLSTAAGGLRGCRGVLAASRPLAWDVWDNAYASAFDDPRFVPVAAAEFAELDIEISVLGPLEPIVVDSEEALLRVLVPDRDGVVLSWRGRRATFLPKVWESLPDPSEFLSQLKQKAGLPRSFWAPDVDIQIYQTDIVAGRPAGVSAI